jgi:mannan endo-1,4-beta-mannosidase
VAFPSPSALSPIRIAPGGRYFETFDGEPFLFIGPNDAVPWPGLSGLFRRKDPEAVDDYLAGLARNGVTVLRLMLEYAHHDHRYFEKPVGRFVPAMVRLWDDLFAACERHGLRVLLAPWDNFWMARRWHRHPYNRANGGPADGPHSFFTDEATIAATINRFRFVIERWGGAARWPPGTCSTKLTPIGAAGRTSKAAFLRASRMRSAPWSKKRGALPGRKP